MLNSSEAKYAKRCDFYLNKREIRISKILMYLGFMTGLFTVIIWFLIPPFGLFVFNVSFLSWYITVLICSIFLATTLFLLSVGGFIFSKFRCKSQKDYIIHNTFVSTIISFYYFISSLVIGWNGWTMAGSEPINFLIIAMPLFSPLILIKLIYSSEKFQFTLLNILKHGEKVEIAKSNILRALNKESNELSDKEQLRQELSLIANVEYSWLEEKLANRKFDEKIRFQVARLIYPDNTEEVLRLLNISIA